MTQNTPTPPSVVGPGGSEVGAPAGGFQRGAVAEGLRAGGAGGSDVGGRRASGGSASGRSASGGGSGMVSLAAVEIAVAGRTVRLHVAEVGLACCAVEQQAATALLASLTRRAQPTAGVRAPDAVPPLPGAAPPPAGAVEPGAVAPDALDAAPLAPLAPLARAAQPTAAAGVPEASDASDAGRDAATAADRADVLDVLVVSGTVTDAMAPSIVRLFERLPEPRAAVAFGACASTGGPYWDSPLVTNGIDQLLPVSAYIPGCPPRPEAFLSGMAALVSALAAVESSGGDPR